MLCGTLLRQAYFSSPCDLPARFITLHSLRVITDCTYEEEPPRIWSMNTISTGELSRWNVRNTLSGRSLAGARVRVALHWGCPACGTLIMTFAQSVADHLKFKLWSPNRVVSESLPIPADTPSVCSCRAAESRIVCFLSI